MCWTVSIRRCFGEKKKKKSETKIAGLYAWATLSIFGFQKQTAGIDSARSSDKSGTTDKKRRGQEYGR